MNFKTSWIGSCEVICLIVLNVWTLYANLFYTYLVLCYKGNDLTFKFNSRNFFFFVKGPISHAHAIDATIDIMESNKNIMFLSLLFAGRLNPPHYFHDMFSLFFFYIYIFFETSFFFPRFLEIVVHRKERLVHKNI